MADAAVPLVEDSIFLPPDPTSPRKIRRFMTEALGGAGFDAELVDTAVLLASELTTNAVLHARSDIGVTIKVLDGCLRVEVADENPRLPTATFVSGDALSGRGLNLVQSAAGSWGIESRDSGKVVWFELDIPS
ncbi:MAG TPA: ATP-binding protein [Acidimicrobiia bacterium]|nr:ATP-binding protein [Acidimicrobiia bacterium]